MLQGDKSSSGFKAGGGDSNHIFETHWEYCPHLLCFFYCVWNSGSPGKHLRHLFPNYPLLVEDKSQISGRLIVKFSFICFMHEKIMHLYNEIVL